MARFFAAFLSVEVRIVDMRAWGGQGLGEGWTSQQLAGAAGQRVGEAARQRSFKVAQPHGSRPTLSGRSSVTQAALTSSQERWVRTSRASQLACRRR